MFSLYVTVVERNYSQSHSMPEPAAPFVALFNHLFAFVPHDEPINVSVKVSCVDIFSKVMRRAIPR